MDYDIQFTPICFTSDIKIGRVVKSKYLPLDNKTSGAEKIWNQWYRIFSNFLKHIEGEELNLLMNYVSSDMYELFSECKIFEESINIR